MACVPFRAGRWVLQHLSTECLAVVAVGSRRRGLLARLVVLLLACVCVCNKVLWRDAWRPTRSDAYICASVCGGERTSLAKPRGLLPSLACVLDFGIRTGADPLTHTGAGLQMGGGGVLLAMSNADVNDKDSAVGPCSDRGRWGWDSVYPGAHTAWRLVVDAWALKGRV